MVEQQILSDPAPNTGLDGVFRALGDPTRRAMLAALGRGERTVGDLAAPFSMSLAGASKHVKVLEEAGLVRRVRRGRAQVCSLNAEPLAGAHAWLDRYAAFWTAKIDDLERLLREEDAAGPKKTSSERKKR